MELQDQVCSLELAKKLKELGVKQESVFVWSNHNSCDENGAFVGAGKGVDCWEVEFEENWGKEAEDVSAFTVAELGVMLPEEIDLPEDRDDFWGLVTASYVENKDLIGYGKYGTGFIPDSLCIGKEGLSEADARAKMLICLIENKLDVTRCKNCTTEVKDDGDVCPECVQGRAGMLTE